MAIEPLCADKPLGRREAQPGAARLCREERSEESFSRTSGGTRPAVSDRDRISHPTPDQDPDASLLHGVTAFRRRFCGLSFSSSASA
jgi:hypothetical protein